MDTLNESKVMKQLSELLTLTIVLGDIATTLNLNTREVKKEDFGSVLLRPDGSERELKLEDSRGCWHKLKFVESGDSYWLRVRTSRHLLEQRTLKFG